MLNLKCIQQRYLHVAALLHVLTNLYYTGIIERQRWFGKEKLLHNTYMSSSLPLIRLSLQQWKQWPYKRGSLSWEGQVVSSHDQCIWNLIWKEGWPLFGVGLIRGVASLDRGNLVVFYHLILHCIGNLTWKERWPLLGVAFIRRAVLYMYWCQLDMLAKAFAQIS